MNDGTKKRLGSDAPTTDKSPGSDNSMEARVEPPERSADYDSDDDQGPELVLCSAYGCGEVLDLPDMVKHISQHEADDSRAEEASMRPSTRARDVRDVPERRPSSASPSPADRREPVRASSRRKSTVGDGDDDERHRPRSHRSHRSQYSHHTQQSRHRSRHRSRPRDGASDEEGDHPRDYHRERRDKERVHRRKHSHERDRDRNRDHRQDVESASRGRDRPRSSWWPFRFATEPKREQNQRPASSKSAKSIRSKSGSETAAAVTAPAVTQVQLKTRLGRAELGRYAHEERMPDWLVVYLKKEWGVCHSGVIPVLQQLLEQSPTTEYAYLCDPCVRHVSRLPKEGPFCGYRNIQTMVSYIMGVQYPGHGLFGDDLPSIFDLQNLIENAWDQGINAHGRIETGGIRWTRKYIGTPEAMAMFRSLAIPCDVQAFKHREPGRAANLLLREVERYFQMGRYRPERKVRATTLPPIYWQHPGHSLTIVGLEKTRTGQTNLLVFDPIFKENAPVPRLVGIPRIVARSPDKLLDLYRREPRYLYRFQAFELLKFAPRPQDLVQLEDEASPGSSRR